jgi:hypothetical protein
MVISYPTGGVLVIDENSIKTIDPDGSVAWRHFVRLSGNGLILLGHDDSVYYSQDTSIVALAHVTGLSNNTLSLLVVIVVDASIIAPYGLVHWLRRRKLREA